MIRTFKAKIFGAGLLTRPGDKQKDHFVTFTKRRTKLKPEQIERIIYGLNADKVFIHNAEYKFDKLPDKDENIKFSVIINGDIFYLDIDVWNKFKANVIHGRYWLYREREWFAKTIISLAIGFLFGLLGQKIGFNQGYKAGQNNQTQQETTDTLIMTQPKEP
jgi:hypothetical protein